MNLKDLQKQATYLRDKDGNPKKALRLMEKYVRQEQDIDSDWVEHLLLKAVLYRDTGDTKTSLNTYKEALEHLPKENIEKRADILRSMSFLAISTTGLENAKSLALKAMGLLEKTAEDEYPKVKANTYAVLGNIFYELGELEKALYNYNEGLDYAKRAGFNERIITLTGDISNVYIAKKDYEKALELLNKYIKEAKNNYRIALPAYYLRRARIYSDIGKMELAKEDIKGAMRISKQENWFRDLGESYEALGNIYLKEDFKKAKKYFEKALFVYKKGEYENLTKRLRKKMDKDFKK